MATTKAMANGNRVTSTGEKTQVARTVAAALERSHPAIDRVCQKRNGNVSLWLAEDVDEKHAITAPEGWEIYGVFVSSVGDHAVRLRRTE